MIQSVKWTFKDSHMVYEAIALVFIRQFRYPPEERITFNVVDPVSTASYGNEEQNLNKHIIRHESFFALAVFFKKERYSPKLGG